MKSYQIIRGVHSCSSADVAWVLHETIFAKDIADAASYASSLKGAYIVKEGESKAYATRVEPLKDHHVSNTAKDNLNE